MTSTDIFGDLLDDNLYGDAADDLVENQRQSAIGEGDGIVQTHQMLVVDPLKHGRQVGGPGMRLAEVGHPEDLDQEPPIIMSTNCRP